MVENELPERILDLLFLRWDDGSYRGWLSSLLADKIVKQEEKFLTCHLCHGLLRDACLVRSEGKQELRCCVCVPGDQTIHKAQINQESVNEKYIKCPLKDEGCEWSDIITKIFSHIKTCDFIQVECPLECLQESENGDKSVTLIERKFLGEHLMVHCSMRSIKCEFCLDELKAYQINEHLEVCLEFLIPCPNSCEEENAIKKIKRKDIPIHLDEDCPLQEVACQNRVDGCNELMERRYQEEHQKNICSMRLVNCEFCSIQMKAFETTEHMYLCEEYLVPCPNSCDEDSGIKMHKRKNIPTHLEIECHLQVVACINADFGCKDKIKRYLVLEHEKNLCPMRIINCEYCDSEIMACGTNEHIETCADFLVMCPNSCLELEETRRYKRKSLQKHLDEQCPLQVIHCPFAEYGCEEKIERNLMERHENDNVAKHFKMSMDRMKQHSIKISELEKDNSSRVDEISRIHKKQTEEISRIRYNNSLEITELKDEINFLISAVNNSPRGSLTWKITNVRAKINVSQKSSSDPFYVGLYKCRCKLVWNYENGGNAACFLYLMKGDCDEKLSWPFRWKYTLMLMNQKSIGQNFVSSSELTVLNQAQKCFQNPAENNHSSFELLELISHERIVKEKYLKNDSITLKLIID